jgi:hypothetical protein
MPVPLVNLIAALDDPYVARVARVMLAPEVRLADGTTGYHVRLPRIDECWAAAVATCIQVPIDDVPDADLDERVNAGEKPDEINRGAWEQFARWLSERDLRMVYHHKVPAARRRWVGIVPDRRAFKAHCLVMDRGKIIFDPTPNMDLFRNFTATEVRWGFSFQAV